MVLNKEAVRILSHSPLNMYILLYLLSVLFVPVFVGDEDDGFEQCCPLAGLLYHHICTIYCYHGSTNCHVKVWTGADV